MTDSEMRTIQQNTEALREHTQALNRLCGLIASMFETPNGGVRKMDTIMAQFAELSEQLHSNTSRNLEVAESIATSANVISNSAEVTAESAKKFLIAAEEMNEAGNKNRYAAECMDEASRRCHY